MARNSVSSGSGVETATRRVSGVARLPAETPRYSRARPAAQSRSDCGYPAVACVSLRAAGRWPQASRICLVCRSDIWSPGKCWHIPHTSQATRLEPATSGAGCSRTAPWPGQRPECPGGKVPWPQRDVFVRNAGSNSPFGFIYQHSCVFRLIP